MCSDDCKSIKSVIMCLIYSNTNGNFIKERQVLFDGDNTDCRSLYINKIEESSYTQVSVLWVSRQILCHLVNTETLII